NSYTVSGEELRDENLHTPAEAVAIKKQAFSTTTMNNGEKLYFLRIGDIWLGYYKNLETRPKDFT
ncbi:MAG: hypothetical protein ACRC11_02470, partial [Xenococcaceae cyanobacterium]